MKQLHLFYLSALLLMWGWGGYRWWQWRLVEAATETPEVAFEVLESSHQNYLFWIHYERSDALDNAFYSYYCQSALRFDSLFHQVERGEKASQVLYDTLKSQFPDLYTLAIKDNAPASLPQQIRIQNALLRLWFDAGCYHPSIQCWFDRQFIYRSEEGVEHTFYVADTVACDFGWRQYFDSHEILWVNGKQLNDKGFDTVFNTPGRHRLDLRLKTQFRYYGFDERTTHYVYVLNHSK